MTSKAFTAKTPRIPVHRAFAGSAKLPRLIPFVFLGVLASWRFRSGF